MQRVCGVLTILLEVCTVRCIEHVTVEAPGVEPLFDDVMHLAEGRRGDRTACCGYLKELVLREFPGLDGMRNEDGLEAGILPPQTLDDPEEEGLCQLPVALGHAR